MTERATPDLYKPFNVLSGAVMIKGNVRVVISAGGNWPGIGAFAPALFEHLDPETVQVLAGTQITYHTSPRDIESGLSRVTDTALQSVEVETRVCAALVVWPSLTERELRQIANIDRTSWERYKVRHEQEGTGRPGRNIPLDCTPSRASQNRNKPAAALLNVTRAARDLTSDTDTHDCLPLDLPVSATHLNAGD